MPRASWSALLVLLSSSTILIAAAASDHPAIAALEEMEATIASHLASARRASGGATPPPGLPPLWANWEAHLFARARDRALDAHAVAIAADPDAPRSPERAPAPLASSCPWYPQRRCWRRGRRSRRKRRDSRFPPD